MAKKKTLGEKIKAKIEKLEALHEKEEGIISDIEEIIEDEPEPFDFELPPPGDLQALREAFERLSRDVQRLQEE